MFYFENASVILLLDPQGFSIRILYYNGVLPESQIIKTTTCMTTMEASVDLQWNFCFTWTTNNKGTKNEKCHILVSFSEG